MRNFTKEELEFVKTCLENCVPKSHFVESVLHTDNRIFHKMCIRAGFEYPNFGKNKIWKNPFENVNSPEVQYWLGWLATDGYVSTNKGAKRCALSLQLRDVDVIEKFQNNKQAYEKFLATGANLSYICPLMYTNNIIANKKPIITNSNKLRTYSNARYFDDEEILEIIVKGEI